MWEIYNSVCTTELLRVVRGVVLGSPQDYYGVWPILLFSLHREVYGAYDILLIMVRRVITHTFGTHTQIRIQTQTHQYTQWHTHKHEEVIH